MQEDTLMERIKVLHLITHLGFGGALDNTLLTVKGHSRDRFEVHLAAGEIEPGEDYSDWSGRAEEYADALFILPKLRRSVQLLDDLRAIREIEKLIKKERYQVVHTHTSKAGILGRIAARRAGVPIVVHTFHAFGWQVAQTQEHSAWRKHATFLKEQFFVGVERYGAAISDGLIAVADLNKQEAIARKVGSPEKIVTIYSGIDMERFNVSAVDRRALCQQLELDPDRPIVGMIGRLSTQKAPLDFVKAAQQVCRSNSQVQFVMVGDGPLATAVKKAIGQEQRIKVLGFMEQVTDIFSVLDVFALSSLWEGLGRALTEAMIMNVPVAATRVGGIPEVVVDKETGLLSDPGNPQQLADNILWLLNHPAEARKISARARNRVVPAFSGSYMVERIEAFYERLLVEKGLSEKVAGISEKRSHKAPEIQQRLSP
jgi:glycosyltransferase involved in cell wall biosynthesis